VVVAERAEKEAVGDEAPEVGVRDVQELLHQPMWGAGGGAGHAFLADLEGHAAAEEVDR